MIFAIALLVLLGLSLFYNLEAFAAKLFRRGLTPGSYSARVSGPRLEEVLREDHDAVSKIAVIDLTGIITGAGFEQGGFSMVDVIKAQLKRAEEDDRVKAVILKVDSPGGEVLASDDIYRAIGAFQQHSLKPVVASMGSVAASGGYYVSAACRWIVANELTITGSIGVILSSWNYRGLMDKVGVRPETYKSGKFKDMLSGSREPGSITDEERAMLQKLINDTYGRFTNVVQEGRQKAYEKGKATHDEKARGRELNSNWPDYADGRVLSGADAFKLGFVDELGGFNDAVERAHKLSGTARANLIEYQLRYDFADFFRIFGKSDAKALKIDLGMEVPKLQAGQLYFLSPTFAH
ncbi:MAG TPA: signal peptide peptidase SppA [Verrucomicrobiae bacterium]